jgi:hypothetical protein
MFEYVSQYEWTISAARQAFAALAAHPSYDFNFENLNNIQSEIHDTVKKRPYAGEIRTLPLFNQCCNFKLLLWVGDLPPMESIIEIEQKEHKKFIIALCAKLTPEFKNAWQGKVYELSVPWMAEFSGKILTNFENLSIEKDFACPISRLDPIRQSWFYLLIQKNILDRGFVSFNLDTSRSSENIKDMDPLIAFEKLYQDYMLNFSSEHKIAKQIVPYRNFPANENLDEVLMKSRFNIILETYFSCNDQIMITEKTIRSLRLPRPWLLYGAAGSVAQLRKWGFDTLDDLVDHSQYDDIENPIERQTKILELAQQLLDFDTVANWQRLKTAAFANNEVLARWKNAFPQAVFDDFYRILDDYAMRNNLPAK